MNLLSKVYINLIDQKEPVLNFKNQEINKFQTNDKNVIYFKKIINLLMKKKKIMKIF